MNRNEKGIIAANIIEAGYLRSHSSPFIWAIRNACLIASEKEYRISLFLFLLALPLAPLICTNVLLLFTILSNNAIAFAKKNKCILYNIIPGPATCISYSKSKGNHPEESLVILTGLSWNNNNNGIMNDSTQKIDNFA